MKSEKEDNLIDSSDTIWQAEQPSPACQSRARRDEEVLRVFLHPSSAALRKESSGVSLRLRMCRVNEAGRLDTPLLNHKRKISGAADI